MMKNIDEIASMLQSLGLNRLESNVYLFLLQAGSPVTAYKIGTSLGRPNANVYKAIDALVRKGAVIVDDGKARLCRPVSPDEFMSHIRSSWIDRTRKTEDLLSRLSPMKQDEGIYNLQSVPLVLEKSRKMLARCEKIAVIDAFPKTLDEILPSIEDAVKRGVDIYLQAYAPCSVPGINIVQPPESAEVLQHWHSHQLNMVVDAKESLIALLNSDITLVHQALWTNSLYMSCICHAGIMREHFFHIVANRMNDSDFPQDLKRILETQPFFHSLDIPGQQELFKLCGLQENLDEP